jgi:hypothetical protein
LGHQAKHTHTKKKQVNRPMTKHVLMIGSWEGFVIEYTNNKQPYCLHLPTQMFWVMLGDLFGSNFKIAKVEEKTSLPTTNILILNRFLNLQSSISPFTKRQA